mmetsp:Transcript_54606/g.130289  ORF Transcript_54606/g.130289 Transcript_54606/m.130289 type:complete len:728 (-) Transcript_54606:51-2234(-)
MQVIYEYDPATGRHVPTQMPADGLFESPSQSLSSSSRPPLRGAAMEAPRRLSQRGKAKLKGLIVQAKSWQELSAIEQALNAGQLGGDIAAKLRLSHEDFLQDRHVPPPPPPAIAPRAYANQPPQHSAQPMSGAGPNMGVPLGAMGLTPQGLQKVRHAITVAPSHDHLTVLDKALASGDLVALKELLDLQPEDLSEAARQSMNVREEDEASTQPPSLPPDAEELDRLLVEVDEIAEAKPSIAKEDSPEEESEQIGPIMGPMPRPTEEAGHESSDVKDDQETTDPTASGSLGVLQDDYAEDGPPAKKSRSQPAQAKTLPWPAAWAWLASRTQRHSDFRPPPLQADSRWAQAVDDEQEGSAPPSIVAIATSLVYTGSASEGYNPHSLGRLTAVDITGRVLMDAMVQPATPLLDTREHLTGLSKDVLLRETALTFDEARDKLLSILRPQSMLVGYRINSDLEALKMWHGPIVDVALLFAVESNKQNQYHPLRYLGERILHEEEGDSSRPHDALETARLIMRLAVHEVGQPEAAPALPPRVGPQNELVVRHIPVSWGDQAAAKVRELLPGVNQADIVVNWLLNEFDPTEWRGDATVTFPSEAARDAAFNALKGLTDIHVQWEDTPGAPPLGNFLTEHSLIKAFALFGPVVAARIPRRPNTGEPLSFGFVSFVEQRDAQQAIKSKSMDIDLSPTWTIKVRPRPAKSGMNTDKRVAVRIPGDDWAQDWVHVVRR